MRNPKWEGGFIFLSTVYLFLSLATGALWLQRMWRIWHARKQGGRQGEGTPEKRQTFRTLPGGSPVRQVRRAAGGGAGLSARPSTFLVFCFLGSVGRCAFFILQVFVTEEMLVERTPINYVFNTLPSFFFFSVYLILISLWAEVYHCVTKARPVPRVLGGRMGVFRFVSLVANIWLYASLGVIYIVDMKRNWQLTTRNQRSGEPPIETALEVAMAVLYLLGAAMFVGYAVAIIVRVKGIMGVDAAEIKRKVITHAGRVSLVITLGFTLRSVLIIAFLCVEEMSLTWWFLPAYFLVLEVIPLLLLVYILRQGVGGGVGAADSEAAPLYSRAPH